MMLQDGWREGGLVSVNPQKLSHLLCATYCGASTTKMRARSKRASETDRENEMGLQG